MFIQKYSAKDINGRKMVAAYRRNSEI